MFFTTISWCKLAVEAIDLLQVEFVKGIPRVIILQLGPHVLTTLKKWAFENISLFLYNAFTVS